MNNRLNYTKQVLRLIEHTQPAANGLFLSDLLCVLSSLDSDIGRLFKGVAVKKDVSLLDVMLTAHHVSTRRERKIIDEISMMVAIVKYTTNNQHLIDTISKYFSALNTEDTPPRFGKLLTHPSYPLDPCIGRDSEIQSLIDTLLKRKKCSAILTGSPGVGKTAIVEGLAKMIREHKIPALLNYRIIQYDAESFMSNAAMVGQLQMKIKAIIAELSEERTIGFFDEVHSIFHGDQSKREIADMLKPAVADGSIRIIGCTTDKEYKQIQKDKALQRRFNRIKVKEPTEEDTVQIINRISSVYSQFHGIQIAPDVAKTLVSLGRKYVTDEHDPDRSIDILDSTAARLRNTGNKNVIEALTSDTNLVLTLDHIYETIAAKTRIDIKNMSSEDIKLLKNLDHSITGVIGQEEAITSMIDEVKKFKIGLREPTRPAVLMFAGRTGVGKTEAAKRLTIALYGDPKRMIRLDMNEYTESHTSARLGGSPPGYVGFEEGGELTEKVKKDPYSIILIDEWEKAHKNVQVKFLAIFDDGAMTDSHGETVDFSKTIIIVTTNMGMNKFKDSLKTMGFGQSHRSESEERELYRQKVKEAIHEQMPPELTGRFDRLIVFRSDFTEEELCAIAKLRMDDVVNRNSKFKISYDGPVLSYIGNKYNEEYGARTIRKYVENEVVGGITKHCIETGNTTCHLSVVDSQLVYK